jgi:hypothetical protein
VHGLRRGIQTASKGHDRGHAPGIPQSGLPRAGE